jgi:hypothetical protein
MIAIPVKGRPACPRALRVLEIGIALKNGRPAMRLNESQLVSKLLKAARLAGATLKCSPSKRNLIM